MSSCNSSNLSGNLNVNSITQSGARLMMTIPIGGFSGGMVGVCPEACHGISAGDAIRYDTDADSVSYQKYVKAQADVAQHAEVIGIVESIEGVDASGSFSSGSVANVVLSGQIKYDTGKLVDATHVGSPTVTGASGGEDIYFLSEVTAGHLQNLAPSTPTTIAKPILQRADDGDFTAHVVNYIGYQIGGEIVGQGDDNNAGGGTIYVLDIPSGTNPVFDGDWFDMSQQNWLSVNTDDYAYQQGWPTYYTQYLTVFGLGYFGRRWLVTIKETPVSSDVNQRITTKNEVGALKVDATLSVMDRSAKVLYLTTVDRADIVVGEKLYCRSGSYTVESAKVTAFATGKREAGPVSSYRDINNQVRNIPSTVAMYIPSDAIASKGGTEGLRGFTVTVPAEVNLKSANIDDLKVGSTDAGKSIVDLVEVIDKMNTDLKTVIDKLSLAKTAHSGIKDT